MRPVLYYSPWGLGRQPNESFFREARCAADSSFCSKDLLDKSNLITVASMLRVESPLDFPAPPRTGACPDLQAVHHRGRLFADTGLQVSDLITVCREGVAEAHEWARSIGIDVSRLLTTPAE